MEIYLVRHTTPAIDKGICYGQSDIPVEASLFEAELAVIQSKIPHGIASCYSSPLSRCTLLAQHIHKDYVTDNRLMELDFGNWENKHWDAINPDTLQLWMQDFVNIAPEGGESYTALHERTKAFINDLLATEKKSALIITHAGTIRSILSWTLGLALQNSFRISLSYGAVVVLEINANPDGNKLIAIK